MDDIAKTLNQAWQRIAPKLDRDPDELRRRLARRRSALIDHPPRAWCLAIRATDTRLASYICSPSHPSTHWPSHTEQILLDSHALQGLCAPVWIEPPGQPIVE